MCAAIGGAGDDRGHPRVAKQVFQEELRPALGESARPVGNRLAAHGAEQPGAAERQRGQHAGLDLGGERQDALFGLAVVDRIVDLHEIRLFAPEHRFDRGKVAVPGRGDADIAADALRLPLLELRQRLLRIAHIVELQQVELLRSSAGPASA